MLFFYEKNVIIQQKHTKTLNEMTNNTVDNLAAVHRTWNTLIAA